MTTAFLRPPISTLFAAALAGVALAGCTTLRETQPAHTATEELLVSHAAEIAAGRLAGTLPARGTAYVDATNFKGENTAYALAAVRAALIARGLTLVGKPEVSRITVEVRAGALSIDQRDVVFGLPAGYLPIPGTLSAFPIPEISLYSENLRRGVAEFAAVAYDTRTRAPLAAVGPTGGERDLRQRRFLTLFTFGSRLERAGEIDGGATARGGPAGGR